MHSKGNRLKLIMVGALILLILSSVCNAGMKKQDPPKFFIRNRSFDVGNVYEGQDISHVYKVRNNGSGELHIINVKPG
jgi:hypothetical protein